MPCARAEAAACGTRWMLSLTKLHCLLPFIGHSPMQPKHAVQLSRLLQVLVGRASDGRVQVTNTSLHEVLLKLI